MPSPTPTPSAALPDFESLHTSFHALVSSLVPPSFVGVSRPQLDVEAIKKEERDRRDRARRKMVERGSGVMGAQEGSSSKSSSIFPQMSDSTKRKISEMRSSTNGIPGPSTTERRSAVNDSSSEDEGESRSSAVKSKKVKLSSTGSAKKRIKSQSVDSFASETKETKNPFKLGEGFQPTSALFTTDNTPSSSPDEPAAPATPTIIPPTSPLTANPPSTPPRFPGAGSLPTSATSHLTSTPSSTLSKNQRKKLRKKEKKALEAGKALQDVVGDE